MVNSKLSVVDSHSDMSLQLDVCLDFRGEVETRDTHVGMLIKKM